MFLTNTYKVRRNYIRKVAIEMSELVQLKEYCLRELQFVHTIRSLNNLLFDLYLLLQQQIKIKKQVIQTSDRMYKLQLPETIFFQLDQLTHFNCNLSDIISPHLICICQEHLWQLPMSQVWLH